MLSIPNVFSGEAPSNSEEFLDNEGIKRFVKLQNKIESLTNQERFVHFFFACC
jgi:hypothetical protein